MKLFCPSCGGNLKNDFITANPHITTGTCIMFVCENCDSLAAVSFVISPEHNTQLLTISLTNTHYECDLEEQYELVRRETRDMPDIGYRLRSSTDGTACTEPFIRDITFRGSPPSQPATA